MPLPKLETPTYNLVVPSTKESIEFRPFLVKEEKILMIAQESKDIVQITDVIRKIVKACTFNKLPVDNLTIYDIEYIFLQLRAKSVGENLTFELPCSECGEKTSISVDLSDINVVEPKKEVSNKIQLNESIGIMMRPIRFKDAANIGDDIVSGIIASIESIFDSEEVYKSDDSSNEELREFVESLNHTQLEKIQEYIENRPSLYHKVEYTCSSCGHKNTFEFSSLSDFFI